MITVNLHNPRTIELLEHYARYVARTDDVSATPAALIEGMLYGFLDEHEGFRDYLATLAGNNLPAPQMRTANRTTRQPDRRRRTALVATA